MRKYLRRLWRATFAGGTFKRRPTDSWREFRRAAPDAAKAGFEAMRKAAR